MMISKIQDVKTEEKQNKLSDVKKPSSDKKPLDFFYKEKHKTHLEIMKRNKSCQ